MQQPGHKKVQQQLSQQQLITKTQDNNFFKKADAKSQQILFGNVSQSVLQIMGNRLYFFLFSSGGVGEGKVSILTCHIFLSGLPSPPEFLDSHPPATPDPPPILSTLYKQIGLPSTYFVNTLSYLW